MDQEAEKHKTIYACFIDLMAAYDTVPRSLHRSRVEANSRPGGNGGENDVEREVGVEEKRGAP